MRLILLYKLEVIENKETLFAELELEELIKSIRFQFVFLRKGRFAKVKLVKTDRFKMRNVRKLKTFLQLI